MMNLLFDNETTAPDEWLIERMRTPVTVYLPIQIGLNDRRLTNRLNRMGRLPPSLA
jgi:hypothetical protein